MPSTGKESLIVALDVPTVQEALRIVEALDNVSFFKIGLQLFLTGGLRTLLQNLQEKSLFVDLKVPGDIANTIGSVIDLCVDMNVKFLTLSESMPISAISAARDVRERHNSKNPELLTVPFLSSLDRDDLREMNMGDDVDSYILRRATAALNAGCDGVVASGQQIRLCRTNFPKTTIVSPGIRLSGTSSDDHKRFTTPKQAIQLGSDYLVVGRPILKSNNPRQVVQSIISEIDSALAENISSSSRRGASSSPQSHSMMSSLHI